MIDRKIIVAYDGSDGSNKALNLAAELAKMVAAKLVLVSVVDLSPLLYYDVGGVPGDLTTLEQKAQETLEEGKKQISALHLKTSTAILQGNPADAIINYAKKEHAYLIVMGSRGLGGFERMLLGSVAQAVVTHSTTPVVVAK